MRGIVFDGQVARVVSNLEVRGPRAGEVIVSVVNAGVCHSDLSVVDGTIPFPVPVVLGHEGAGIVEEVGEGVTTVKPGDHVALTTLASCGRCEACTTGTPTRCPRSLGNAAQTFAIDGQPAWGFAATASFSERTVVTEVQCVKIPEDVPLTSACLVGCGVVTGAGAVWNRAQVERGSKAVVVGVGGVGLNVIQALRIAGASRIIAVDTVAAKADLAARMGATEFVDASEDDAVEAVGALLAGPGAPAGGPVGADYVFECVGAPALVTQAFAMLGWGGTVVVVGVAEPGAVLTVLLGGFTYVDRGIIGCRYGTVRPHKDIPFIVDLYRQGRYLLDELVSAVHPLEEFDAVAQKVRRGELARGVLAL